MLMQHLVISHGPIEDPSPVAHASRYFILGQTDGLVSYKATSGLIASSNCCFSDWEIDLHLLALLKVGCSVGSYELFECSISMLVAFVNLISAYSR